MCLRRECFHQRFGMTVVIHGRTRARCGRAEDGRGRGRCRGRDARGPGAVAGQPQAGGGDAAQAGETDRPDERPARDGGDGVLWLCHASTLRTPGIWLYGRAAPLLGTFVTSPEQPLIARASLGHVGRCFGSTRQAELIEDAADVVLDRLLGEEEDLADLPVRLALRELLEHLALLVGERRERWIFVAAALPNALEDLAGDVGVEQRPSLRHRVDRFNDGLTSRLLEEIARRSRDDGCEQSLVVSVGGQHDDLRLRSRLADRSACLHATAIGRRTSMMITSGLAL